MFRLSVYLFFFYSPLWIVTLLLLGLEPDLHSLPCRYFFVQLLNADGSNATDSSTAVEVTVAGQLLRVDGDGGGGPCRAWTELLRRYDGVRIVRYRLFLPCRGLVISVLAGTGLVFRMF